MNHASTAETPLTFMPALVEDMARGLHKGLVYRASLNVSPGLAQVVHVLGARR